MNTSLSGPYSCACLPYVIRVSDANGTYYVLLEKLIFLEATQKYTVFYIDGKEEGICICFNLGYFEKLLPINFVRVHNSHIVNFYFVKYIDKNGKMHLDTDQKHDIVLGRTKIKEYEIAFEAWNNERLKQFEQLKNMHAMLDNLCVHQFLNIPHIGTQPSTEISSEPPPEPTTGPTTDTPENPLVP